MADWSCEMLQEVAPECHGSRPLFGTGFLRSFFGGLMCPLETNNLTAPDGLQRALDGVNSGIDGLNPARPGSILGLSRTLHRTAA